MEHMKNVVLTAIGATGAFIAQALGGWDTAVIVLLALMGIDYLTGVICALAFHKSSKTGSGGFSSAVGWQGLAKKCVTLLLVVVANLLDMQLGASYIRDGVCIAFMANEVMSIVENAGLMGVPIPGVISKALEVLHGDKEKDLNG